MAERLVVALLVAPPAGHLLGYLPAALAHVVDPVWPTHARFHVSQSLFLVLGWDIAAILVALGQFRRGTPRMRWILWLYFLFVQLGYFASMAVVPAGIPPGRVFHVLYLIATAMFATGLILTHRIYSSSTND